MAYRVRGSGHWFKTLGSVFFLVLGFRAVQAAWL